MRTGRSVLAIHSGPGVFIVNPTPQSYAGVEHQMEIATVPEPSSTALLTMSLGAFAVLAQRKRRSILSMKKGCGPVSASRGSIEEAT